MTEEEAIKLARIFETADGGCDTCACRLAEVFNKLFSDLPFEMRDHDRQLKPSIWCDIPDEPAFLRVVRKDEQ